MKKLSLLLVLIVGTLGLKAQAPNLNIGDSFPNFSYQGQFTKKYQLSELKGSYVLVQYWSSWNAESRAMQQDFIDVYARYRDRKFKKARKFYIVSISLDEELHTWEIALKKDNLPWKSHACDGLGWKSPLVSMVNLEQLPANFLLDPNGRIIAKNIKKDELDEILKPL